MANKIVLKKSSVAAKVPLSTDLEVGEIAVNLVDQKLYSKKADGTVVLVGTGVGGGGSGDVVGAGSSTDNAITRFDGTTGKLIQNSSVIIDDSNNVTGVNSLTATTLVVNDNATLGGSNTDSLAVNARITTDLEPATNNARDIGTNGRNWRDGFFGRTLHTVNLDLTGTTSFDGAQGTSGQVLTSAGTGNTPTWTTPTVGTVTSVTGTAPVVSSGGATPAISISQSGTSTDGYLSSTDWNTFNSKTTNTGTVTSVAATVPSFLSVSGSPITTSGTLALTYSGTALPVANGGTGLTAPGSSGNVLTSNGSEWVSSSAAGGFPSGTALLFQQTAAPTGWTKSTTHNNKALRVVSGTASSGGTVAFTTAFASQAVSGSVSTSIGNTTATGSVSLSGGSVAATTLSTAQMPIHNHNFNANTGTNRAYTVFGSEAGIQGATFTGNTGSGNSHTHSLTNPTASFSGTAHNHTASSSFSGTAINLDVLYVDVIIATKD
jgi:hypothetical protein